MSVGGDASGRLSVIKAEFFDSYSEYSPIDVSEYGII